MASRKLILPPRWSPPGLGQLMVDAVSNRDIAVVQAVALIFACAYVLLNLLADVLSTLSNPRLMHQR